MENHMQNKPYTTGSNKQGEPTQIYKTHPHGPRKLRREIASMMRRMARAKANEARFDAKRKPVEAEAVSL
jgi:hypothetical protein